MSAGAALAGPYVNVETNAGWTGADYSGATTDIHLGYEGALGEKGSYYVQGGIAVVTPDGGDTDTVPSGKAGLGFGRPMLWEHMVKSPSRVLAMTTSTVVMAVRSV